MSQVSNTRSSYAVSQEEVSIP